MRYNGTNLTTQLPVNTKMLFFHPKKFELLASEAGFDLSMTSQLDTVRFIGENNQTELLTTSVALHRGIDSKFLLHISGDSSPFGIQPALVICEHYNL